MNSLDMRVGLNPVGAGVMNLCGKQKDLQGNYLLFVLAELKNAKISK